MYCIDDDKEFEEGNGKENEIGKMGTDIENVVVEALISVRRHLISRHSI
jgi:hypothetical protein